MQLKTSLVTMAGEQEQITVMGWATELFHLDGSEDLPTRVLWEYMISLAGYVRTKRWDLNMRDRMFNH